MSRFVQGDVGGVVAWQVAPTLDLTAASVSSAELRGPSGSRVVVTGATITPLTRTVAYTIKTGEIDLPGTYAIVAVLSLSGGRTVREVCMFAVSRIDQPGSTTQTSR